MFLLERMEWKNGQTNMQLQKPQLVLLSQCLLQLLLLQYKSKRDQTPQKQ
jgi:hypothetical protein